jgi:flagellar secretion chaperone FliS
MNLLNPFETYKQQSVMAATPGELTLMLYEGCLKFLRYGKIYIENKNIQESNNNLIKAQNIISELMNTLDMKYSISGQLLSLYIFMNREIAQANIKKDADRLDGVIDLVSELHDTWQQTIQIDRSNRYVE